MINTAFSSNSNSNHPSINWSAIIIFALGFWLSASFVLDFVLIPSLSLTGMMNNGGFASAGFVIFGVFNHIELICASLILTSILVLVSKDYFFGKKAVISIILGSLLLVIALAYTYVFTPHLTAEGLCLNQFSDDLGMSPEMILWHQGYWVLELCKYLFCGVLFRWSFQNSCSIN